MAEWSALQTDKRGDSGSIPAVVKTFFLWRNQKVSNEILVVILN